MQSSHKKLKVTEDQALFFRARRGHLAGPGAETALQCARDIVGAQSQVLQPGLLALSQRTAGRPTAAALMEQLFAPGRDLVRTWGQRGTIHIYSADETWPMVTAARRNWYEPGRRGPMPSARAEKKALTLARKKGVVLRKDFQPCVEESYLEELDDRIGDRKAKMTFACSRFSWRLCLEGHLCQGEKRGSMQTYPTRESWFPDLIWPEIDPLDACLELTRRYLAMAAPATVQDVAHYFGARVKDARLWVQALQDAGELLDVDCGGRKGLLALATDEEVLRLKPGRSAARWPTRFLPLWDTLLMNHADKSWTVPDEAQRPLIWKKAAMVVSVVLHRGRVAAVWGPDRQSRRVDFHIEVLPGHGRSALEKAVRKEAEAVAAHLELECGEIRW